MATRTYEVLVQLPDGSTGRQTVTEEVDDVFLAFQANSQSLLDKASQALAANTTFLAVASPTNAQIAAQVRLLTRQNNALIRILLGAFESTDGT